MSLWFLFPRRLSVDSMHSLAAREVDKQMHTLWSLERQLQDGFYMATGELMKDPE